uniref:Uncharacterized protein n=1 Tax=Anopheles merus TaxID=30066 RepID=A0A182VBK4_ANOME
MSQVTYFGSYLISDLRKALRSIERRMVSVSPGPPPGTAVPAVAESASAAAALFALEQAEEAVPAEALGVVGPVPELAVSWLAAEVASEVLGTPPATVGTAVEPPSLPAGMIGESVVDKADITVGMEVVLVVLATVEPSTAPPLPVGPGFGRVGESCSCSFCTIRRSVTVVIRWGVWDAVAPLSPPPPLPSPSFTVTDPGK